MKKTNIVVLGRLLPDSGKTHQNQEVYSAGGSEICTIKACHYKDPPKILIDVARRDKNEDNPIRKYEKRNTEV